MAYFAKKPNVKTLFDIGQNKEGSSDHSLLLEIGKDHCTGAVFNRSTNTIDHIRFDSLDELESASQLREMLLPYKETGFQSVTVCSAYPEALLYPNKFFSNNYLLLDQLYDLPARNYFHDTIGEWQMVNAYALPEAVCHAVEEVFGTVSYLHAYTPAIKVYNGFVADHQVSVHFSTQSFRVLLKKDMTIHLVQTYTYQTPLDVVYYLLKICYEFGLRQQDAFLILSGLVEKESNLFTELQQYFTNIHFAQEPEIGLPQSPHPHHFFTSIYNLAACVS